MKKSNDTIGNRARDLPACSTVPQQTASPRAAQNNSTRINGAVFQELLKLGVPTGESTRIWNTGVNLRNVVLRKEQNSIRNE